MTEQVTASAPETPKNESKPEIEKYPAMQFVAKFARLVGTIIAFAFVLFAIVVIIMGIFTEASFVLSLINAGFYLLIGSVLVGLVKGAGEAFEVLLELEKRK